MNKSKDVIIAFNLPELKLIFTELFLKKIEKPLHVKFSIKNAPKENIYKHLLNTSRWLTITINDTYFGSRFWKRNHIEFSNFLFSFFNFLFLNLKTIENKYLLKVVFKSSKGEKFYFLFGEAYSIDLLKSSFSSMINKIEGYRKNELKVVKEIRKSFSLKSKEFFYEFKNNNWAIVNLLYNAGKYHHDEIVKNIHDKRIAKPDIVANEEYLNRVIAYPALWCLKANGKELFRTKPNDISLYSNIAVKNLKKAKEIYDNESSVLWKYIQMPESDVELLNYYELIITSIILAFSSVEVLINIAIPWDYIHKRLEKNKKTNRMKVFKYSKNKIERWYSLDDKMNIVLPAALNIPLPNQQKWWFKFDKLKKLRDEIIHAVDSNSNNRYSKLLEKGVFEIIGSHIEVIMFFGKWATDNKHHLLNALPYGFGYDDIMPILMSTKDFKETKKEIHNITDLRK